jgi:hypothetical protein
MPSRQNARELLEKGSLAVAASEAAAANAQAGGIPKALQMANLAQIKPLALDAGTPAAGAAWRSLLWGLQVQLKGIRPEGLVYNFITRYSNGCNDAGHTGILTPMSPIFDQEPKLRAFQNEAFG